MGTSDAVEEFCPDAIKIRASDLRNDSQTRCYLHGSKRNDAERHAGGDDLCRETGIEIVRRKVEGCSERITIFSAIPDLTEDRVVLPHRAEDSLFAGLWRCEPYRDRADAEVKCDLLGAAQNGMIPVEPARSAQGRMAG